MADQKDVLNFLGSSKTKCNLFTQVYDVQCAVKASMNVLV